MHLLQGATYHHLRPSENVLPINGLIAKKSLLKSLTTKIAKLPLANLVDRLCTEERNPHFCSPLLSHTHCSTECPFYLRSI